MPVTKVPVFSYPFPAAPSYPLPGVDWNQVSGSGPHAIWSAPGDILQARDFIPRTDSWTSKLKFASPLGEAYASITFVNGVILGAFGWGFRVGVLKNSTAVYNDSGYDLQYTAGGVYIFNRNSIVISTAPLAIVPGDILEIDAIQTAPGVITVTLLLNGIIFFTYVDAAPLTAPNFFGMSITASNAGSTVDIGPIEFGTFLHPNPIHRIPLLGNYLNLPTVKG